MKIDLVDLMSDRPFCFLGLLLGLKDFFFGLGSVIEAPDLMKSILYQNYDSILPGMAGWAMGVMFIPLSLVLIIAALLDKKTLVRICLTLQATVWLFNAFMYVVTGSWFLAAIFFLAFSAVPGYASQWMGHWKKVDGIMRAV